MVFSSPIFLFAFLPIVLLASLALGKKAQNPLLLLASLFFYAWGEPIFVLALLVSIGFNFAIGRALDAKESNRLVWLSFGVALNLSMLVALKYGVFVLENLSALPGAAWLVRASASWPAMPIGISFYTFQALSYLVDVYRGECRARNSIAGVGLYLSLFPQLIAGPIVRYSEIEWQLEKRERSVSMIGEGALRFVRGLAKKVLIADTLAIAADMSFDAEPGTLSMALAWFGLLCYGFQLYFDFSGYSDMAIGIGRMLGFRFPENFDFPYSAKSVREFWRRWHMTLSRWFRDYLYIPLGGNRKSLGRVGLNLMVVFALCGLWHGASWSFLIWGLSHGVFLVLERSKFGDFLARCPSLFQRVYLMGVVFLGWVLFRSDSLEAAADFCSALFGGTSAGLVNLETIGTEVYVALGIAVAFSTPTLQALWRRWNHSESSFFGGILTRSIALIVLALCMATVASNTYSPFLYFRF